MHRTADNYIPSLVSSAIYQDFLADGVSPATITFVPIEGAGHNSDVMPFGVASINWFLEIIKMN